MIHSRGQVETFIGVGNKLMRPSLLLSNEIKFVFKIDHDPDLCSSVYVERWQASHTHSHS